MVLQDVFLDIEPLVGVVATFFHPGMGKPLPRSLAGQLVTRSRPDHETVNKGHSSGENQASSHLYSVKVGV